MAADCSKAVLPKDSGGEKGEYNAWFSRYENVYASEVPMALVIPVRCGGESVLYEKLQEAVAGLLEAPRVSWIWLIRALVLAVVPAPAPG